VLFYNDRPPQTICSLSLHDALPISEPVWGSVPAVLIAAVSWQRGEIGLDKRRPRRCTEQELSAVVRAQEVAPAQLGVCLQKPVEARGFALQRTMGDDARPGHRQRVVAYLSGWRMRIA